MKHHSLPAVICLAFWLCAPCALLAEDKSLNVLFIGNSFTGRHTLSQVVKTMAEAGQPGLKIEVTTSS